MSNPYAVYLKLIKYCVPTVIEQKIFKYGYPFFTVFCYILTESLYHYIVKSAMFLHQRK